MKNSFSSRGGSLEIISIRSEPEPLLFHQPVRRWLINITDGYYVGKIIMNLSFNAPYVHCTNAMDWEIQQVDFDTIKNNKDNSEENRETPYVLISRNFEFPDPATIEWHNGKKYDGGATIQSAILNVNQIQIVLDDCRRIKVSFDLNKTQFEELRKYLQNILEGRLNTEPTKNLSEPRVRGPLDLNVRHKI